jgi:hypothetical protein
MHGPEITKIDRKIVRVRIVVSMQNLKFHSGRAKCLTQKIIKQWRQASEISYSNR